MLLLDRLSETSPSQLSNNQVLIAFQLATQLTVSFSPVRFAFDAIAVTRTLLSTRNLGTTIGRIGAVFRAADLVSRSEVEGTLREHLDNNFSEFRRSGLTSIVMEPGPSLFFGTLALNLGRSFLASNSNSESSGSTPSSVIEDLLADF